MGALKEVGLVVSGKAAALRTEWTGQDDVVRYIKAKRRVLNIITTKFCSELRSFS